MASKPQKRKPPPRGKAPLKPARNSAPKRARAERKEAIPPVKIAPVQPVEAPRNPEPAVPPPMERERSAYDGDTAIKLYLREIGQVELLTPEQEITLAERIKLGRGGVSLVLLDQSVCVVVKRSCWMVFMVLDRKLVFCRKRCGL
jgi:hypothetical protein